MSVDSGKPGAKQAPIPKIIATDIKETLSKLVSLLIDNLKMNVKFLSTNAPLHLDKLLSKVINKVNRHQEEITAAVSQVEIQCYRYMARVCGNNEENEETKAYSHIVIDKLNREMGNNFRDHFTRHQATDQAAKGKQGLASPSKADLKMIIDQ